MIMMLLVRLMIMIVMMTVMALEQLTRYTRDEQVANFLTWGKWNLDDAAIEKLVKDQEIKERVSFHLVLQHLGNWN